MLTILVIARSDCRHMKPKLKFSLKDCSFEMLRPEVYFSYHTAIHSLCMLTHNFLLSLSVAVNWDSSCSNLSNSTLDRCVASSLSFCCCPFLKYASLFLPLVGSCWTVYSTVYLPLFAPPLHHRSSQVHEPQQPFSLIHHQHQCLDFMGDWFCYCCPSGQRPLDHKISR